MRSPSRNRHASRALIFSAVLVFSAFTFAQTAGQSGAPPESKLQSWLRSGDPQSVAWGAHYVLTTGDQALVPDLVSLAASWQPLPQFESDGIRQRKLSDEDLDRRDSIAAVLDALIQLNASLPVDDLRNLATDFPNYVAVFLGRMPLKESAALNFDLYREPHADGNHPSLQYVSAALLAQDPPPGFAADLLSGVHIHAEILVVTPGNQFGSGGGGHDCAVFDPPAQRQQWPSFGVYQFSMEKSAGSFLAVPGIDPIYGSRSDSTHYAGDSCAHAVRLDPEQRRRLLAQILSASPASIGWGTALQPSIEFRSEAQFSSDLQAFIAVQQEKYRATAAALVAKGLMNSAEQEESLPRLELQISDMRGSGFSPIAEPPGLPANVTWMSSPWR